MSQTNYLNISKNPLNIIYLFSLKNKPISDPLGQNVPQRVLKSMPEIVYTGIMEIKQLSNNMDAKCQVGNRWTGSFLA